MIFSICTSDSSLSHGAIEYKDWQVLKTTNLQKMDNFHPSLKESKWEPSSKTFELYIYQAGARHVDVIISYISTHCMVFMPPPIISIPSWT